MTGNTRRKSARREQPAPALNKGFTAAAGAYAPDLFWAHNCCPSTTLDCVTWFIQIILTPLSWGSVGLVAVGSRVWRAQNGFVGCTAIQLISLTEMSAN
jgi:hypothetical protein